MWQIDWKARIGRRHWQGGEVTAFIGKRWGGRLEVRKQLRHWKMFI